MNMARTRTLMTFALIAAVLAPAGGPVAGAESVTATHAVSREVYGFFTASERQYMLEVADYSTLTTIAYFAIDAKADGSLARLRANGSPTSAWAAWTSTWMDQVIAKAHASGTRVVMTVTRFAWASEGRAEMIALLENPAARARLATEIADAVTARGVDGVNIDFEPIPTAVADEFVTFVREVRSALDARQAGLHLAFDTTGYATNYDIASLTASGAADAVFIMGYPYHGSFSQRAGATSPLSGLTYDLTDTVDRILAQTTPDKVILGLPYYGYEWSTQTRYVHSLVRPEGPTYGTSRSRRIGEAIAMGNRYGTRWDAAQMVPWTRWLYRACSTCPQTWRQLYFENVRSLGLKYDLVNARDLAGVGFWRIGYEGNRPSLYRLLREKFPAD
jgi:spore germination protein YaaH